VGDNTTGKQNSRGYGFPVATLSILLLLYILSPGPVVKFLIDPNKPSRPVEMFFAPLDWAYNHVPGVEQFYDWYFEVWAIDSK
jgi:hypothetical protein